MRFLTILGLFLLALVSAGAVVEGSIRAFSTSGAVAFNAGRWSIRVILLQYRANRAYYRLEVVKNG